MLRAFMVSGICFRATGRPDIAGRDAVAGDAKVAKLQRNRLVRPAIRACRDVSGLKRRGDQRMRRCGLDDAATSSPSCRAPQRGSREGRRQVDADDRVPFLGRNSSIGGTVLDAGVVHEDVARAELRFRGLIIAAISAAWSFGGEYSALTPNSFRCRTAPSRSRRRAETVDQNVGSVLAKARAMPARCRRWNRDERRFSL